MRAVLLPVILVPLAFAASPAFAQSDPSTDSIIQSLKPAGNVAPGLRGIKTVVPEGTQPAPDAKASSAMQAQSEPSVSLTVEFSMNSTDLTPRARQTLDKLGRALTSKDLAQFHFRIEGHTDTVGSPEYNKSLSQRRADAVAAYLETNFGVVPERLQAVGLGMEGLLVATPPQTANAQNRRVKVVNLGG